MSALARPKKRAPGDGTPPGAVLTESRSLLRIAAPITVSQLGSIGMTTMDTIMVGPLGADALAAVGLAVSLHWAMLVVTTGTLFGMSPLVSQRHGAGDRGACDAVLVQGIWLAIFLAVPMVIVNLLGEPIALALGQRQEMAREVGRYMAALAWGVPPILVFFAFRQYLEGMSLARPAMVATFLGLVVNFFANRAFIYGDGGLVEPMGAVGSGWATSVVRWAMGVGLVAWAVLLSDLRLSRLRATLNLPVLRRIVSIGVPTGAQISFETGFFAFAAVMMGWFGSEELGTHQVAINLVATTFMFALGVSLAGSIRVGQHLGAGDRRSARRVIGITYLLSSGYMAFFAILFLWIPGLMLGLYTADPAVVRLGTSLLFVAAFFQLFDGAQVAAIGVLRGAADTRVPMLMAGASYWLVGAPAAYLLGFHTPLGPSGVWTGMVLGLAMATVLLGWRVRTIHWRSAP